MKLFAQHGHAPADKIVRGLQAGYIGGVVLSPRYVRPVDVEGLAASVTAADRECEILLDPEYLATRYVDAPNAHLRYLDQWSHFAPVQRDEFLASTAAVERVVRDCLAVQRTSGCTSFIAPNIYIGSSFDSLDGAVALSFLSRSGLVAREMGIEAPLYATVAVSMNALIDQRERASFLNSLTSITPLPDGVYMLVGASPADERGRSARSELMVPEVIAGSMLANHACAINGMRVLNGYSDLLTPLLGIAGGYAGATGWYSNLQVFSPGRYLKLSSGRRQPLVRYLSRLLLSRITNSERKAYAEFVPEVMNGTATDAPYLSEVAEPDRTDEALQSWDTLASLTDSVVAHALGDGLADMHERIRAAQEAFARLQAVGFTENYEANMDYLGALAEGIELFKRLAEI